LFKIILFLGIFIVMVVSTLHISQYTIPFKMKPLDLVFSFIFFVVTLTILLRIWVGQYRRKLKKAGKIFLTLGLLLFSISVNVGFWRHDGSLPRVLGDRINSWLNPWHDYDLSYQYINSLWLMKDTGLGGNAPRTLEVAVHVPLIEQDLSFSLYVSVLGFFGILLILLTLFMLLLGFYQLIARHAYGAFQWHGYALEFMAVIFSAQFIFPALYVVGLLPIMSQPIPFLSYSNNMLLLFTLPFSFLTMVLINNLKKT
jgi:cell division protein FtsW (lipid II flippase)